MIPSFSIKKLYWTAEEQEDDEGRGGGRGGGVSNPLQLACVYVEHLSVRLRAEVMWPACTSTEAIFSQWHCRNARHFDGRLHWPRWRKGRGRTEPGGKKEEMKEAWAMGNQIESDASLCSLGSGPVLNQNQNRENKQRCLVWILSLGPVLNQNQKYRVM